MYSLFQNGLAWNRTTVLSKISRTELQAFWERVMARYLHHFLFGKPEARNRAGPKTGTQLKAELTHTPFSVSRDGSPAVPS